MCKYKTHNVCEYHISAPSGEDLGNAPECESPHPRAAEGRPVLKEGGVPLCSPPTWLRKVGPPSGNTTTEHGPRRYALNVLEAFSEYCSGNDEGKTLEDKGELMFHTTDCSTTKGNKTVVVLFAFPSPD